METKCWNQLCTRRWFLAVLAVLMFLGGIFISACVLSNNPVLRFKFDNDANDALEFHSHKYMGWDTFEKKPPPDLVVNTTRVKTLYVGIMSAEAFLNTRAEACLNTWVKGLSPKHVEFFCHLENRSAWKDWKGNIVDLEGVQDDVYPPLEKLFRMFQYICSLHLHNYDWFLKTDDDTYVRTDKLVKLLGTLNKDKMIYHGFLGYGGSRIRHRLKLDGHGYCKGGPGFLLSRPAMIALCPHLEGCLTKAMSEHDDVELGRCVIQHLGMDCTHDELFHHPYVPNPADGSDPENLTSALTLHPVKDPQLMYNLYREDLSDMSRRRCQRNATKEGLCLR